MKKILPLLAAALFMNVMSVKSQIEDVTATYIPNAGFEACTVVETVDGAAKLITADKNPMDYADCGWAYYMAYDGSSAYNAGATTYPIKVKYSKWLSGIEGPQAGPVAGDNTKALCFTGNKSAIYKQTDEITLPAGSYKFTVNVWVYNGGTSNPSPTIDASNVTGFVTADKEYLSEKKMFLSSAWDTDVIELELTEPATGRFQLSYGASYFVVVDDIKLKYNGGIITTALLNVISKAHVLNAKLNNADLALAIGDAEAFAANPTSQEDVPLQVETLYSAMGTALIASEGVVDITDVYVDNPSFETGKIDPWAWGGVAGSIHEPTNEDSKPYIDGVNVVEFDTSSGTKKLTQTIPYVPAGCYAIDAKLCQKAFMLLGTNRTSCTGGSGTLYLRAHPAIYTAAEAGELTIGAEYSSSYRIDNFRLFYGKDEASLLATLLETVKADALAVSAMTEFDAITGSERTNLMTAIEGTDSEAINTALNNFVAAKDNYNRFAKAKENAAPYNAENYPYASKELLEQIQNILALDAASSVQAQSLTTELNEACTNVYYSNAYCDGVEKTDYTDQIVGAKATSEGIDAAWTNTSSYMTIVTDLGSWTNPKTQTTDNTVYGVTTDYYRACANKTSAMQQTIANMPAGKYVVAITAKTTSDTPITVKVNSLEIGSLTGNGTTSAAAWVEGVFTYEKATDGNMILRIECTPTANYKKWGFDNVRLYYLGNGTGIQQVNGNAKKEHVAYDLSGRRVAQPKKGLYIIDGQKVVKK